MIEIKYDVKLKDYNSFGVDASAKMMAKWDSVDDLRSIFSSVISGEWMVLSGGCNILFTQDYSGVLLHPKKRGIEVVAQRGGYVEVKVDAATDWDCFVGEMVSSGLYGAENLSLIPGMVGAAPIQNIGAYGVEAKDIIDRVECYLPYEDRLVEIAASDCKFSYRGSIFKQELKGKAIVTAVYFRLKREYIPNLDYGDLSKKVKSIDAISAREAVIEIRKKKLPDLKVLGNGGSFFKNPVVDREIANQLIDRFANIPNFDTDLGVKIPAAWMIDRAGWKGFRRGDCGVHSEQALVLVNYGMATGAQVLELAHEIISDVKAKFGVVIEPEINII